MIYKPQYVKVRPKVLKDKKIARQVNALIDYQFKKILPEIRDKIRYGVLYGAWE